VRPRPDRETREVRRRAWIKRFADRQRYLRQWILVPDLTNWCAQSTTTTGGAEQERARNLALELLADSILKAQFEREGRSKVLFLSSRVTGLGSVPCRLQREAFEEQYRNAGAMTPATPLPLEVLARCWLPRGLARQWIKAHGYRWPKHFEPSATPAAPSARRENRQPVVRRPSRQRPFWSDARKITFDWLGEYGYPRPSDGGQANLERHIAGWLADHGHTASESTIRKYVKDWIKEYKASLSAPE